MKVLVIHGPNLNLLGTRELAVYGSKSLDEVNTDIEKAASELGVEVEIHQSASEGTIIDLLHSGFDRVDGAVLNPAAYSHTSRAIADAIRAVPFPVIEVHLSNPQAREVWRQLSITGEAAKAAVMGFGWRSYTAALRTLVETLRDA